MQLPPFSLVGPQDDDRLKSTPAVQEAIKLCMRSGFRFHKFISNSKEVVEFIAIASCAKEIKELDFNHDLPNCYMWSTTGVTAWPTSFSFIHK